MYIFRYKPFPYLRLFPEGGMSDVQLWSWLWAFLMALDKCCWILFQELCQYIPHVFYCGRSVLKLQLCNKVLLSVGTEFAGKQIPENHLAQLKLYGHCVAPAPPPLCWQPLFCSLHLWAWLFQTPHRSGLMCSLSVQPGLSHGAYSCPLGSGSRVVEFPLSPWRLSDATSYVHSTLAFSIELVYTP